MSDTFRFYYLRIFSQSIIMNMNILRLSVNKCMTKSSKWMNICYLLSLGEELANSNFGFDFLYLLHIQLYNTLTIINISFSCIEIDKTVFELKRTDLVSCMYLQDINRKSDQSNPYL